MQEFLPNRNSPRFVCQTTLSSNQVTSSVRTLWLPVRTSCGSVVEHCVSGFNSQGTHIFKTCIAWMHCKSLWIKASAKCVNVNVNSLLIAR